MTSTGSMLIKRKQPLSFFQISIYLWQSSKNKLAITHAQSLCGQPAVISFSKISGFILTTAAALLPALPLLVLVDSSDKAGRRSKKAAVQIERSTRMLSEKTNVGAVVERWLNKCLWGYCGFTATTILLFISLDQKYGASLISYTSFAKKQNKTKDSQLSPGRPVANKKNCS